MQQKMVLLQLLELHEGQMQTLSQVQQELARQTQIQTEQRKASYFLERRADQASAIAGKRDRSGRGAAAVMGRRGRRRSRSRRRRILRAGPAP